MLEILATKAIDKALDILVGKFSSTIIERWSKYRAKQFFISFVAEISKTKSFENTDEMLLEILKDERKSEILFEAYRKVVLSASKELGPRIIGFLTAKLMAENRVANDTEERIAMAAESLNDNELTEFSEYFDEHLSKAEKIKESGVILKNGDLKIELHSESQDSNWLNDSINVSPMPFSEIVGVWALKLKNLGVIREEIIEQYWKYKEDSERYIDMDGSVKKITWWLIISDEYKTFSDLIKAAINLNKQK